MKKIILIVICIISIFTLNSCKNRWREFPSRDIAIDMHGFLGSVIFKYNESKDVCELSAYFSISGYDNVDGILYRKILKVRAFFDVIYQNDYGKEKKYRNVSADFLIQYDGYGDYTAELDISSHRFWLKNKNVKKIIYDEAEYKYVRNEKYLLTIEEKQAIASAKFVGSLSGMFGGMLTSVILFVIQDNKFKKEITRRKYRF